MHCEESIRMREAAHIISEHLRKEWENDPGGVTAVRRTIVIL